MITRDNRYRQTSPSRRGSPPRSLAASKRCAAGCLALYLTAFLFLAGCGLSENGAGSNGKLQIVATTTWHSDLVRTIGGEAVDVEGLMGSGVDPHLYTATAGDVETLAGADLAVRNGLELEGKMDRVFENVAKRVPVITVGEAVPEPARIPIEGVPGKEYDPHIWFDPDAWRAAAGAVADGLTEADPANAPVYRENLAAFEKTIAETKSAIRRLVATIPPRSRVLVTSHDAFSYFARAFGFEVASIQGKSTATEATTADIERVAKTVADAKLKAVFIESSVPQQTIDAVLAAAERQGQTAAEGGSLYGDAMGSADTAEGTWAGAIMHNAKVIAAGLGEGSTGQGKGDTDA